MANTCFTTYKIVGKKEEIEQLHGKLQELENMKEALLKSDYGNLWLGCLVHILGGNWQEVYCRGRVICFQMDEKNDCLEVCTETAWAEMEEVRHFIQKVFPSLNIYFYEEEPMMEIYRTNDKEGRFFKGKYIFDDMEGEGEDYYNTEKEVLKIASECMGRTFSDLEELEEAVGESDDFSFHKVEICA